MLLNLIYNTGICIYALSLLFYISDCVSRNPVAKRIGTGLLVITSLLLAAGIGLRAMTEGHFPVSTPSDFLLLLAFSIAVISLAFHWLNKSEYAILLMNIVGFAVMLLNRQWISEGNNVLTSWETEHRLLLLHIGLASISFAALTVGAVFAAMYMFLHRKLKVKQWNDTIRRLPSLEMLDLYSYRALIIGTWILVGSLALAVVSVASAGRWSLLTDIKVLTTLIALGMYMVYFMKRRLWKYTGKQAALWALVGYGFIVLNFFLNAWSNFHSWAGV